MQIPPDKKHSKVHWTHGKNKMEEAIAVRHFIICHIPFILRELQFKIAQYHIYFCFNLEGHSQLESFHQNIFNPIAEISCTLGDYPCNRVYKYLSRLIRNTKKSYDTADFTVLLMWWLITLIHASEHKIVCVCERERERERERESNTENDAESNPVVNVAKIIAENAIRKLCNTVTNVWHQNMQIVRAKSQLRQNILVKDLTRTTAPKD